ncbi:hypothetical protein OSB04_024856 [Centaurea solstitialis]|uniref:Uncharacterized protein n=1 Tax=Centaurea solstitialis TaxID=347529 RepID=A0AA38WCH4_9ASTR|nr:hypothetical protein OSB04_024856 [Centaurea solstitialis]
MEETATNGEEMIHNQATVDALYKALAAGNTKIVAGLLAADLEWWFHGPQDCHHMMRMLTGRPHTPSSSSTPRVLQREYFNTWLTVKELRVGPVGWPLGRGEKEKRSTVWRSQPRDLFRRSLPGLMLAI